MYNTLIILKFPEQRELLEFLQGKGWMPKAAAHNNATPEGTGGEA
jgi:hypothetical protein